MAEHNHSHRNDLSRSQDKRERLKLSFSGACSRKNSSLSNFSGCHPPPAERGWVTHSIQSSGKLKISPEVTYDFTADDLTDLGEIGRGSFWYSQ
ncbi:dual specificity mitogen-activated protein kinase kinase 4 [Caerostris extrusa]|uniref:Dual specificity mitogen-activated protein kinase kinase 4 n=1 Tax=Caerostris extrusa TaxID=172846 RepID=A0AAV4S6W8_CAEEX|nr:dual specificity mitogen-activated protein kinase kinase 4 [Caerostris extrusa]